MRIGRIPSSTHMAALIAAGFLFTAFAGLGLSAQGHAGHGAQPQKPKASITLTTTPKTPVMGENTFTLTVKGTDGKPLVGAEVSLALVMPAMPVMGMPEMRHTVTLKAPEDAKQAAEGVYTGKGQIAMAGKWNVTITVKKDGTTFEDEKLTLTAQ